MSAAESRNLPAFSLSNGQQLAISEKAGRRTFQLVEPSASRKVLGRDLEFSQEERAAFEAGEIAAEQLAEVYGVSPTAVRDAMRRQRLHQERERSA